MFKINIIVVYFVIYRIIFEIVDAILDNLFDVPTLTEIYQFTKVFETTNSVDPVQTPMRRLNWDLTV